MDVEFQSMILHSVAVLLSQLRSTCCEATVCSILESSPTKACMWIETAWAPCWPKKVDIIQKGKQYRSKEIESKIIKRQWFNFIPSV